MIVDLIFMAKISEQRKTCRLRGSAFAAWAVGSLCAVIAHIEFPQSLVSGLAVTVLPVTLYCQTET
ncbi:hypothetical protein LZ023_39380 (plasmid) [Pseudomonas silvicola]|nr:hypothetical protein LZ023_39380 [Pseudomonas silvicola]